MGKERFRAIPAVYLSLIKDNKVLLLLRKNTGFEDGNYGLVSGHLESNERIIQAMVRETKEEDGIGYIKQVLEDVKNKKIYRETIKKAILNKVCLFRMYVSCFVLLKIRLYFFNNFNHPVGFSVVDPFKIFYLN